MKSLIENEFSEHLKVAQNMSTLTNQVEVARRMI